MLVEQHPDGYPTHVETIQEILNILADDRVCAVRLFVFHDSLSHGGDHIIMPVPDGLQDLHKPEGGGDRGERCREGT